MKQLLITIAAMLLAGCEAQAPKGSVHIYAQEGDIIALKQQGFLLDPNGIRVMAYRL